MNPILLSVIIPTKFNRLDDLSRKAIQSALNIQYDDIEVVLHVDDDIEGSHFLDVESFANEFDDIRLKLYIHSKPLTMTQNWEMAIGKARGEYIIIIGDDDSIREEVYYLTKWAKEKNLDNVIKNPNTAQYYWDTYPDLKKASFLMGMGIDGDVFFPDIKETIFKNSIGPKMNYYSLQPQIYHGIVRRKTMDRMKKITGKYFGSSIPDLYFAFAFAFFIKKYAIVNYPFSLSGYSMKGNSGKFKKNSVAIEKNNYLEEAWPVYIPKTSDFVSLYAKCKLDAYVDTGNMNLIKNIRPFSIFAQCFLNKPHNLIRYNDLINQFNLFVKERKTFFILSYFILFYWMCINFFKMINLKMPYIFHLFERTNNVIYKKKPDFSVKTENIEKANIMLSDWIKKNGIYDCLLKKLKEK